MSYIAAAMAQYQRLREQVLALDSELDEQTLLDTLEGLTDLHEIVAAVVRFAMADEVLASGLRSRMKDLQQRLERLENRALKQRAIARDVMAEAGIRKITAPDFTISLRTGSPSLVVTDERAIPETYWRPQAPKLDRHAVLGALKSGASVPGAQLSNVQPVLSVRTN